jgi:mannose-6-phosphate isomerase-like protein (cupin superfamily)
MRRVVTGHDKNHKSVFISDTETTRAVTLDDFPDVKMLDEIWATDETPSIPVETNDPTIAMDSFVPSPGGTRFRFFVTLPEERWTTLLEQGKDMAALFEEFRSKAPGLAESMEVEDPGMHTTDTIDYGVVLSGEVYLELDDGQEVLLKQGDTYVQNGTRHAWRNRGKEPCVIAVVMIGAKRS